MTDDIPPDLTKICTVKVMKRWIYPLDPDGEMGDPGIGTIYVARGSEFPVYRDHGGLYLWEMTGVRGGPTREPVTARSRSYDLAGFKAFLNDPLCQTGPQQRWSFRLDGPLPTGKRDDILGLFEDMVGKFLYYDRKESGVGVGVIQEAVRTGELTVEEMIEEFGTRLRKALKKP